MRSGSFHITKFDATSKIYKLSTTFRHRHTLDFIDMSVLSSIL